MNRRQFLESVGLMALGLWGCQTKAQRMAAVQLDAAAPWRERFRCPKIWWARIARTAPTRGLAVARLSGAYQLHAWDVPTGILRPLTKRPDGVMDGRIGPDGRYVYYLEDHKGNEIGHLVRVPFDGGEPLDLTPDMPAYANLGCSISRRGNILAFTVATRGRHQLCCVSLGPGDSVGSPRILHESRYGLSDPAVCSDGTLVVVPSMERARKRQPGLLAFDIASGSQITELWDGPGTSVWSGFFAVRAGDPRLIGSSNRSGMHRPLIWNVRTGERTDIPLPDFQDDVYALDWSADGNRILLSQFSRAVQQLYLYDMDDRTARPLKHPSGTFRAASLRSRDEEILVTWQDATHPSCLIALDATTGRQTRTVLAAGAPPPCRPLRSITFKSSDGQEIQGWLAVPEGTGPFPAVLKVHGGPHAVEREDFDAGCQAWLDHGFAFLTINYRGSATFGRAFEEQIWGHPGDWELEDMVAAQTWLIDQGIALRDQILLTGRSYGGYLTLLALGKRPGLWAGGMAHVAIGDFALAYEDTSESLKAWDVAMFGGTPQEKPDQYKASSPITYAEHVRAPVLMIQGRNDSRCPARQAQAYTDKMRALGKDIEVHWFDAGHRRADTERDVEHMEWMLRFAARVLG